jgi:S-formylglutathione hydrolase FrmB
MAMRKLLGVAIMAWVALAALPAAARVERVTVHGASLEGNLEGNSPDRTVFVVLPPSYDKEKKRRFPVVYFLHGFTATAEKYMDYIKFDEVVQQYASANEVIYVLPDSFTKLGGSMYASGPTVGNFEAFVAKDLVAWVDGHYRSIARRESRGLAGHSMGGYGTFRIGMKFPDVFSSLYAMSSCCLSARRATPGDARFEKATMEEALNADFFGKAYFATAAAFSPDPAKQPFYAGFLTQDGKVDPMVEARWAANAPAVFIAQYVPALKSMEAITMDVGDQDFLLDDNKLMDRELTRFDIAHNFTLYEGDHGNRVPQRVREFVLPFFAHHLDGQTRR